MEVANIECLLARLVALRDSWKAEWNEASLVESSLQIEVRLSRDRSSTTKNRTSFRVEDTPDENVKEMNEADEKAFFRKHISMYCWRMLLEVSVQQDIFIIPSAFIGTKKMQIEELNRKAAKIAEKYSKDISSEDHVQEWNLITIFYNPNFYIGQLGALELLIALAECKLKSIFSNLVVCLRMFPTAPITVTSAERSFSKLKKISQINNGSGSPEQPG